MLTVVRREFNFVWLRAKKTDQCRVELIRFLLVNCQPAYGLSGFSLPVLRRVGRSFVSVLSPELPSVLVPSGAGG